MEKTNSIQQAILLIGIYPQDMKQSFEKMYAHCHYLQHSVKQSAWGQQSKYTRTEEWIMKLWCIDTQ